MGLLYARSCWYPRVYQGQYIYILDFYLFSATLIMTEFGLKNKGISCLLTSYAELHSSARTLLILPLLLDMIEGVFSKVEVGYEWHRSDIGKG